jgi:hypothetical protein
MQNQIDIDHKHSQAICQEIGERLQAYLKVDPEPSASLKKQVLQLEGQSPSIVPDARRREGDAQKIRDRSSQQYEASFDARCCAAPFF